MSITSTSPDPASTGTPVTVQFTVNSATPVTNISVDWGDGTITHPGNTATLDTHVYVTSSNEISHTFTINVTATNNAGIGFATASEVINDRPPILAITGLSPSPAYQGGTVNLRFSATDPDGVVTSTWIDWGDGTSPDLLLNVTSSSMCQRVTDPSTDLCTLPVGWVIDVKGGATSSIVVPPSSYSTNDCPGVSLNPQGSIIVFHEPGDPPNFLIVHRVYRAVIISGQVYYDTKGDANNCADGNQIGASDIKGVYQIIFTTFTGPLGVRYGSHYYPALADSPSTTYTIRVNATDTEASTSYGTTMVTIYDQPPVATITRLVSTSTSTGTNATLFFSVSELDGTVSSIRIDWGDGTIATLDGTVTSSEHAYTTPGSYTVSLSATDNVGSTSQPSTRTVIVNKPSSGVSTAPTIFGLAQNLFYGIVAASLVAVGAATAFALRSRKKI